MQHLLAQPVGEVGGDGVVKEEAVLHESIPISRREGRESGMVALVASIGVKQTVKASRYIRFSFYGLESFKCR